jgi:hypothetical protein
MLFDFLDERIEEARPAALRIASTRVFFGKYHSPRCWA